MLKLITKEILFCKICNELFTTENKPFILSCGNTLCYSCMIKLTKVDIDYLDKSCMFDQTHHHIFEEVPVNYLYLDIVQNFKKNLKNKMKINEENIEEFLKCDHMDIGKIIHNDKKIEIKENLKLNGYHEINKDDCKYKGEYLNGLRHGYGEYESKDLIYKGNFVNDLFEGNGEKFIKSEKKKLLGTFQEGLENGECLITTENISKPIKVLYKKGKLITILDL